MSETTLTSQFESNWRKIEAEAALIKKENLLPYSFKDIDGTIAERTVEDFDSQLGNLKTEKFTISVCGMVKAGKSTFLNALLFGEDILPAFDTPMTAKLNFIEYTEEKNHFVVNYYDRTEWNDLRKSLDEENLRQLDERVQICSESYDGIDEDILIGAPSHKEMDLRKLEEFVSDPKSKKGKYTPFVKDVHIFIHNDSIKDVRIVDTPGLNDPNVINSRETTKWIKNTHALIFLLPNKGLDESSLNFFDTHLLGTTPSNRVWVINKIDDITEDDLKKTKAYIRELGKQEEFRQKNLFGRDEKICGYSALIAMLRNMEASGANLDEDQIYHLENVRDGENFNPDPDGLPGIIGERLYQNTGIKRIIAGFTAINTVYSQHLKNLAKTIMEKELLINDSSKSDKDIKQEIDLLVEKGDALENNLDWWKVDLASSVKTIVKDEVAQKAHKAVDGIKHKINSKIDSSTKAEELRRLPFTCQDECNKMFGPYSELSGAVNDCSNALKDELQMIVKKIRNLFVQNEIEGIVDFTALNALSIEFKLDDLFNSVSYDINDKLPGNWFTEFWKSKNTMKEEVKTVFEEYFTSLYSQVEHQISNLEVQINKQIDGSFIKFSYGIEKNIQKKKDYLESDAEERQKKLDMAKQEMKDAQDMENHLKELQRIFKQQFPQEISTSN